MISNLADNTVNNNLCRRGNMLSWSINQTRPSKSKGQSIKYVTVQKLHFSYLLFNVIQRNVLSLIKNETHCGFEIKTNVNV